MKHVLQTQNLCKQYGNFTALNNVGMHVKEGDIYGFVGQNGAGKTTLMRLITGMQLPSGGSFCLLDAQSGGGAREINKARARMGAIVETPSIQLSLTAKQNLTAQNILRGNPSRAGIDEILALVGLTDTGAKKAKDFSLGMRQRLAIATALLGNPDFLVLDEPTNGLDPHGIIEIRELLLKLNKERNVTILISSHILGELSKLATCYGFIDRGALIQEISAAELENKSNKKTVITVTSTKTLPVAFDGAGISYKIVSETKAELYSEIKVGRLSELVEKAGAELLDYAVTEEDLEAYFINLTGGNKHA